MAAHPRRRRGPLCLILLGLACSAGEGEVRPEPTPSSEAAPDLLDGRPLPPHSLPEIVQEIREDEAQPRSSSDGAGRAIISPADPVTVGSSGAWTIHFRAGPAGIAEGGAVILQISPFWDWSDPQPVDPDYPGYTRVETDVEGVELVLEPCGTGCIRIGIAGAPLPPDGAVRIHYGGEGAGAARVDRFAEVEEEFFLRVDGDGDGVTAPVVDPPTLDILPGPVGAFYAVLPSTARVGDEIFLNVAALDAQFDAATDFEGELLVVETGGLDGLPPRIRFDREHSGTRRIAARATQPGITRVLLGLPEEEGLFRTNPLEIGAADAADRPRILWADLHGHSGLSDGTGSPEDYMRYARDFGALDVAALTDHDHWGLRFLDREPALWERIRASVERFHAPGRFVALLGYEWTSWLFGHRHVLYFQDDGPVFGSFDPASDEPEELWALLGERRALTVPHHPGGGPIPVDWSIPPDPRFEPVVEIVSVHGSSECLRCPESIYSPVEGAFVRDALARGYRLGIIGSGDTHDGHPGVGAPENRTVGLTALLAESLDRASVLEALRERRVYATSGPRILLEFEVSGVGMGGMLRLGSSPPARRIRARAVGTAPIAGIDVVKSGEVAFSVEGNGEEVLELEVLDEEPPAPGEYLYVRVVQVDGGLAWSSPVWVETGGGR